MNSLSIIKEILVGYGPENIVKWDNKVFVANSGGWTNDNRVSVIDPDLDIVTDSIEVGDNPIDLVVDINGDIWVLCKGKVVYDQYWNIIDETDSEIFVINNDDLSIKNSFAIGQTGDFYSPVRLACSNDGSIIYFLEADGIYRMEVSETIPPVIPFIERSFYGLDIDQKDGTIYGLSANNFASDGYMFRFTTAGVLLDSLKVGVGPGSVVTN